MCNTDHNRGVAKKSATHRTWNWITRHADRTSDDFYMSLLIESFYSLEHAMGKNLQKKVFNSISNKFQYLDQSEGPLGAFLYYVLLNDWIYVGVLYSCTDFSCTQ